MNMLLKKRLLVLFMVSCSLVSIAQRKNKNPEKTLKFPMTEKNWNPVTKNVEFTTYKGTEVAQSSDGNGFGIMLKDYEFINGTIEYDVELKGQGFPGINFRTSKDTTNSEIFYLRHFGKPQPLLRTTMQYAAIIDEVNLWDLTDEYQAAATLKENSWNHIKLVIHGKQMKVYVNDMSKPALLVPSLEGVTNSGGIGLSGNVIYANMVVKPNATEDLPAIAGYKPTDNDPYYLRNWKVTTPQDLPFGKDILMGIGRNPGVTVDPQYLDSTAVWTPVTSKYRGVVNLTYDFGGTKNGKRRLVWLKTTINSEKQQEKLLRLGFSDEVWVFINGQPLHFDRNYYGSPGMKEPIGRASLNNTAFEVPFKKGNNEILIGLSNYFYGWGIIARFDEMNGLSLE